MNNIVSQVDLGNKFSKIISFQMVVKVFSKNATKPLLERIVDLSSLDLADFPFSSCIDAFDALFKNTQISVVFELHKL